MFYNNLTFRIAGPLFLGIVVYLLVLMFFDSVGMLASNFFSRELLFVIGLTLLFFELNRIVILILAKIFTPPDRLVLWILLQYLVSLLLTPLVISLILYLYFVNIEGFSTIGTELITFNSIYLFAAVFYHLYYFSLYFLYKRNDELVRTEKINRDSLELELKTYKSQINPEFLFQTLEIILEELPKDKKRTDDLIDSLAKVYRYTLDSQQNDLNSLRDELDSLDPVLAIYRTKYPDAVFINVALDPDDWYSLVPGTLQTLFEYAMIKNLISDNIPMNFSITRVKEHLKIRYPLNERIADVETNEFRIKNLIKTYNYLSGEGFKSFIEKRMQHFEIPLLKVEEE